MSTEPHNPFTLNLQTTVSHQHQYVTLNLQCKERHPQPLSPIKTNIFSHFSYFQASPPTTMDQSHDSTTVDTTRPFRSVKEAVAIFGERLQLSDIHSPSPKPTFTLPKQEASIWKSTPDSNDHTLWKSPERDHEPSPVVMNTLKKLELELDETKRELKMLKERESETEVALASLNAELHKNMSKMAKAEAEAAGKAAAIRSSMTLRQVLSGVGGEGEKGGDRIKYLYDKKVLKKKPVVPLVTDLFAWKSGKGIHY